MIEKEPATEDEGKEEGDQHTANSEEPTATGSPAALYFVCGAGRGGGQRHRGWLPVGAIGQGNETHRRGGRAFIADDRTFSYE